MIYFDNAATSFPKPAGVSRAMVEYIETVGANPGRSGYEASAQAARIVFDTRSQLASLFNVGDSRQVVFTKNATEAINTVLYGFLQPGDEVVTTGMEHNAAMRPLHDLEETRGIKLHIAPCDTKGYLNLDALAKLVSSSTKLVVVNHASNVTGTIQPLAAVRERIRTVPMLVDAAQTAGAISIDVQRDGVDFLAFTGHKSLLGPQGTGGLYIRPGLESEVRPLIRGGTGSNSEQVIMPHILPDKFEAGTTNTAGVAGLGASLRYVTEQGIEAIHAREQELTANLINGLSGVTGLAIHGPGADEDRMPVVSFTIDGIAPSEIGQRLTRDYSIACRVGLHCAPTAHQTTGTFPGGTVRLSLGHATTAAEVQQAIDAVAAIAGGSA